MNKASSNTTSSAVSKSAVLNQPQTKPSLKRKDREPLPNKTVRPKIETSTNSIPKEPPIRVQLKNGLYMSCEKTNFFSRNCIYIIQGTIEERTKYQTIV